MASVSSYATHLFSSSVAHDQSYTSISAQKRADFMSGKTSFTDFKCIYSGKCHILSMPSHSLHIARRTSHSVGRRSVNAVATLSISAAAKRENDPRKRVVITGMGIVSVFGSDVDEFYSRLLAGESGITVIDKFSVLEFPVKIGGQIHHFDPQGYVDPRKGRCIDDSSKYSLVAGWKALEDAGLDRRVLQTMDMTRIGALVGSGVGGPNILAAGIQNFVDHGYHRISTYFVPHHTVNASAAMLAIDAGFMGPVYSISTACASSNFCIYAAANHIRDGDADVIVAGGTEAPFLPHAMAAFIACRAVSTRNDPKRASRPWDRDRDGFVMGEGCGLLVMESMEHAMKRGANILAEYLGGAVMCDAYHITSPRPDGLGISACITKALDNARVSPEEVNYVNAHATSTRAGDIAELIALNTVFKDTSDMKMNATKSMIGHGLAASAGMEAIATIKAITTGWLHPTLNQENLEPEVTIDTIPDVKRRHDVNVAISNAFGFGGHNSVVVFAPFNP